MTKMKTIEERAQGYIYRNGLMHRGMGYCDAKEAYIEIATEQKKIDFDNIMEIVVLNYDKWVFEGYTASMVADEIKKKITEE